jgi:hypothetical protein
MSVISLSIIQFSRRPRLLSRLLLVCCALILVFLSLGASKSDETVNTGDKKAKTSCCGGTGFRWYITRTIHDEVVDEAWLIPAEGKWVYSAFPSKSEKGGLIYLAALITPLKDGEKGPDLKAGQRYYDGRIPGVGIIIAQQFEEGETWVFNYRGYEIKDSEGYIQGGKINIKATSELPGRWKETWEGGIGDGVWAAVNCTGQVDYVFGSSGQQREELQPDEQEMGFVELPIPGIVGHFLGRCHEVGEIWTVVIDGKAYSATVTEKDPKARPLDQPPPSPAGGPPPSSGT